MQILDMDETIKLKKNENCKIITYPAGLEDRDVRVSLMKPKNIRTDCFSIASFYLSFVEML
jgi:hypothetical protein